MNARLLLNAAAGAVMALIVAIALLLLATPMFVARASADTLWDQSAVDEFGPGYYNSLSGLPPFGTTLYAVGDVTVGAGGWVIESISQSYSALDGEWGLAITQGRLVVIPKTGALPGADPSTGPMVAMTGVMVDNHWVVTASGLNVVLGPGQYWLGITPAAPSGPFGPEIHLSTTVPMMDDSPWYDPYGVMGAPGWSVPSPGYDCTLLVTGVVNNPTPTLRTSWGAIKRLYR